MTYHPMFRSAAMMAASLALVVGTAGAQGGMKEPKGAMRGHMTGAQTRMMADWPQASKDAAMFMTRKYGAPAAITADMAVWGRTGPWKRTIVYRVEHPHDFPMHHTDVMQQWIDYKAPPAMYDDLAMYDGSVVPERTSGELSARCDREAANFLALNLADEIVNGKRSVEDARKMYGEQIMSMKAGKPAPYTERLMFGVMTDTEDKDMPLSMPMPMPGAR